MMRILFQLLSMTVIIGSTKPVIVKFQVDLAYMLVQMLGADMVAGLLYTQIPLMFPDIPPQNILGVNVSDAKGFTELSIGIDPNTPDLANVLIHVEQFVASGTEMSASGFTIKPINGSYSVYGMPEESGPETTIPTKVEVKYASMLPYSEIDSVGRNDVLSGIRQFTQDYINITDQDMKHFDIYNDDGMVGVEMNISSLTPNIYDVMLDAMALVACGTIIEGDDLPDIGLDPDSFEVVYSAGVDPVITGDETIICPGITTEPKATTTNATTTTERTKTPTAGTGKTSGMGLVVIPLSVVVLIVY